MMSCETRVPLLLLLLLLLLYYFDISISLQVLCGNSVLCDSVHIVKLQTPRVQNFLKLLTV